MITFPLIILAIENDDDRLFMQNIYLDYHKLMFSIAYQVAENKYVAEDLVSETCVSLIDKIDTLRGLAEKQRYYYVAAAARNKVIDYARNRKRINQKVTYADDDAQFYDPTHDCDVDERIMREVELDILRKALLELRDQDKDILRMKYFELRSDAEIASHFGIGTASVRYYLTVARRALREALKKHE